VHRDIGQIGRCSSFSLLLALSLKHRAGRDVELRLYNMINGGMQGVAVKSTHLSDLHIQPLLDSITECDAKFVTQLGKGYDARIPVRKDHVRFSMIYDGSQA